MAVVSHLNDKELALLTMPDDTEEAPWLIMADVQVRAVDLLKSILALHARRQRLSWYLASYLKITTARPGSGGPLDVAPDLLVAWGAERLRPSWNVSAEGKAPEFVLEVASASSWERDAQEKPLVYEAIGVQEYAIFAPERGDGGPRLSGYRRQPQGGFTYWEPSPAGVLWSTVLGLGLVEHEHIQLRAIDARGNLLPTPIELAGAEAAAREKLEAEVQQLRQELFRLRREQR